MHQKNFVEMNIRDDGKGFDTSKSYSGNGMNTLRKRAAEMNGGVKIVSSINIGTTIELKFKIT
jgi:signal transduction histidine kinase